MYRDGETGERSKANMVSAQRKQRGRMRVGWALLMFALTLPALASENQQRVVPDGSGWVQESAGPLSSEKSLQVTRFVGSVRVVTGAPSGSYLLRLHSEEPLEKDAREQFSSFHLGVGRRSGEVLIQTVGPVDLAVRAELILQISSGTEEVHVDTLAGKITIQGSVDHLDLKTHGGDIEVVRCMGSLMVHTAGGNINLGEMGGDVSAVSGGGNIRVGVAHGEVVARTAQGNIELWKLSEGADAHTGRGRITAEFVGDRNSTRKSELVTSMGDIVVYFAGTVSGNLHAVAGTSPSQHILSEFPELKISNGIAEYGPRSVAAEGAIHGGGPMIDMRTMAGQIELRNAR
jgi:hypothetical protein